MPKTHVVGVRFGCSGVTEHIGMCRVAIYGKQYFITLVFRSAVRTNPLFVDRNVTRYEARIMVTIMIHALDS